MAHDFFPKREAELVGWSANLSEKISTDPERYGLSVEIAADFAEKRAVFAQRYLAGNTPATQSRLATELKNDAMRSMKKCARLINAIAKAAPGVSSADCMDLGLNPRGPGRGADINRPAHAPVLRVADVRGRHVKLQLFESSDITRPRKPEKVAEALVFGYVGAEPPAGRAGWTLMANTSRANATVYFPDATLPPGTKVWLVACWSNQKGEHGPISPSAYTFLGYEISARNAQAA